jgi:hypothetical protein
MAKILLTSEAVIRRVAPALVSFALTLTCATTASADGATWAERYGAARTDMVEGRYTKAEAEFRKLAAQATNDSQRTLATEMASLAGSYASRSAATPPTRAREIRSTDELTLLYATAFLYGAGTGSWFLLQTEPDSAVTATLPFAAFTAAPVIAVATADGYKKLPRGLPQAISAGAYLGLGEGIWLVGYQNAKASRLEDVDPETSFRWSAATTASVLWGSATLGAILGGALGAGIDETPGRVSFTTSTAMWGGAIFGLGAGAVLRDDELRRERAFVAAGFGYNAGLAGGILFAGDVSPSVARVRLIDLIGIGGGVATAGTYLSATDDVDVRLAEGLAAIGAAAGLAVGWLATSGMPKDTTRPAMNLMPSMVAVPGGATLGLRGSL